MQGDGGDHVGEPRSGEKVPLLLYCFTALLPYGLARELRGWKSGNLSRLDTPCPLLRLTLQTGQQVQDLVALAVRQEQEQVARLRPGESGFDGLKV